MANLQEIFMRIKQNKQEQKKLKAVYKDSLDNNPEYRELNEKLKDLKIRKKQIETDIKSQFSSELTKLEDMKIDLDSDMEMISDLALNQLIKGERVTVKDENEAEYEPIFNVKFKKST